MCTSDTCSISVLLLLYDMIHICVVCFSTQSAECFVWRFCVCSMRPAERPDSCLRGALRNLIWLGSIYYCSLAASVQRLDPNVLLCSSFPVVHFCASAAASRGPREAVLRHLLADHRSHFETHDSVEAQLERVLRAIGAHGHPGRPQQQGRQRQQQQQQHRRPRGACCKQS